MGNRIQTGHTLSKDDLQEYADLLYLKKSEILHIYQRFCKLDPIVLTDRSHRISRQRVLVEFSELAHNPFLDRIFLIFSRLQDDHFSFEDMLDLCSALSPQCPTDVKAMWAFKIFDFDHDKTLKHDDLIEIIKRLTTYEDHQEHFTTEELDFIVQAVIKDMDLDETGEIAPKEFEHAVSKLPEFSASFTLKF